MARVDEAVAAYLEWALEEDDAQIIAAPPGDIARSKGMATIAERTGLARFRKTSRGSSKPMAFCVIWSPCLRQASRRFGRGAQRSLSASIAGALIPASSSRIGQPMNSRAGSTSCRT